MSNEPDRMDEPEIEVLEGPLVTAAYVGALDKAQIDVQIATAKQYPRSVQKALNEAMTLATMDEETAAGMFYVLPRSGKKIEGPSARLAEVMAYSWQNLRAEADVIDVDDKYVTAMGTCFDLERNVAVRVRVKRRITDKNGNRFNDDMIGVTSNAATSIALRNAVFKVIPQALTKRIYEAARQASIGKTGTMEQKRQKAIDWFTKNGFKEAQVFELVGVKGLADVGEDQLIELRGIMTALRDGETTVSELLNRSKVESDGAKDLNAAVKGAADPDAEATANALYKQFDNQLATATTIKQVADIEKNVRARKSALDAGQFDTLMDRVKEARLNLE